MYKSGGAQSSLTLPIFDIVTLIAGLLLALTPVSAIALMLRIIGLALLIYAAFRGFVLFRVYKRDAVFMIILVSLALLFFIGTLLLVNPGGALRFVASATGAYMLSGGVMRLYRTAKIESLPARVLQYALSILILILGFSLLIHPSGAVRISGILIGASLIINSAASLISRKRALHTKVQRGKMDDLITADFTDKSDEL